VKEHRVWRQPDDRSRRNRETERRDERANSRVDSGAPARPDGLVTETVAPFAWRPVRSPIVKTTNAVTTTIASVRQGEGVRDSSWLQEPHRLHRRHDPSNNSFG
jgi:hypothetical protein